MRKLLFITVLLLTPQISNAAITVVQNKKAGYTTTQNLSAGAFASNVAAGNLIAVGVIVISTTATVSSVTDTLSNTYVQAVTKLSSTPTLRVDWWYAKNIAGGADTVTVNLSASVSQAVVAVEISGLHTTSPLDQTSGGNGNSSALNSGSMTTLTNDEIILGIGATSDGFFTAPTLGTNFSDFPTAATWTGSVDSRAEYRIVAATGSYAATLTGAGTGDWSMIMATFKIASAASTPKGWTWYGW